MSKKNRLVLIITASIAALLLAFLVGVFSYRTTLLSNLKKLIIQAPQPTESIPEILPDFAFEFLNDPHSVSMNSLSLLDNQNPLKFIVAGHIYGKPGDGESHPATNLLSNITLIKETAPDFIIFLGDTVWNPSEENFNDLDLFVLDQFGVPVFNAVGNHDVTNRDLYQSRYGNTVYSFRYKDQLFFILDTTLKYYDLTSDQYLFISNTIKEQSRGLETIHLFMHHVLFLDEGEIFDNQLLKPNEGDGKSPGFLAFLETELIPISKTIPIYVYAGDVGAFQGGNLSPFYKKLADHNITFLTTGLGNNYYDSILVVETENNGLLNIQPVSLTGRNLKTIETFNIQYWINQ